MVEMKAMADENRRLKRMYAKVSMQNDLLKEALEKNDPARSAPRVGRRGGVEKGRQYRPSQDARIGSARHAPRTA